MDFPADAPENDVDAAGAVAPDDDLTAAPSASRNRRRAVGVGLLGVLFLGAAGYAGVKHQEVNELRGDLRGLRADVDTTGELNTVVGSFAEALLTYSFEDLDASSESIAKVSTPKFAQEYDEAFELGLAAQIEELKATSEATIHNVFVSPTSDDTARAIVIAGTEITSDEGNKAAVNSYLDISLVRLDGKWLVDDVTTVANVNQAGTPAPTTDTTVPNTSPTTVAPTPTTAP